EAGRLRRERRQVDGVAVGARRVGVHAGHVEGVGVAAAELGPVAHAEVVERVVRPAGGARGGRAAAAAGLVPVVLPGRDAVLVPAARGGDAVRRVDEVAVVAGGAGDERGGVDVVGVEAVGRRVGGGRVDHVEVVGDVG